MEVIPEIQLNKGYCGFPFGAHCENAVLHFGAPEEIQELNDELLDNAVVYHYWSKGFSLFFDPAQNMAFTSVETNNEDTTLFNTNLFTLREKELVTLMQQNGFKMTDSEMHEWGEKRVSFDGAGLDCYFENHRLISINFSYTEISPAFNYSPN